ncbi:MAG: glycine betaine ABC transporter substrate-binding protein, partial [Mycobacteriaceae bacterium]
MKTRTGLGTPGLMVVIVASALVLSACGSSSGASSAAAATAGSIAAGVDLKGVSLSVGSKEYTEQKVLGQVLVQTLRAAGATVKDQTGLTGTKVVRAALDSGQIDLYYEYTGTAWLTILGKTQPINDPQQLFAAVSAADKTKNNVDWFAMAPLNDTYAVGATAKAAKSTGVTTLSQYADLAKRDPSAAKICSSAEFATREDGLPGLEKHYGFTLPQSSIFPAESTVVFQAASQGNCNFLKLDSTDARIAQQGIVALQDDKAFFPVYNPAVSMRDAAYSAHQAQYDKLLGPVSKLLTQDAIIKLNGEVELKGLPVEKVVHDFLKKNN